MSNVFVKIHLSAKTESFLFTIWIKKSSQKERGASQTPLNSVPSMEPNNQIYKTGSTLTTNRKSYKPIIA